MPKHDLLLTAVFCGLPFFAVLYTSGSSFIAMRLQSPATSSFRRAWVSASAWALVFLAIGFLGWARSDGTLRPFSEEEMFTDLLASANLAGVDFVNTPPDWLDYDDAQGVYRRQWCENRNINEFACGAGPLDYDAESAAHQSDQRRFWCRDHFDPNASTATCSALWASLEDTYATEWHRHRNQQHAALRARDFAGIDLRRANLSEASLIGADLTLARMEGATLTQARMEGATLTQARMEGATLTLARMEGANLRYARMEGADLWRARMDTSTSLDLATFEGAALREVDYSVVAISAEQVNASFGDTSVILPETLRSAPDHWLTWQPAYWSLDETAVTFLSEYRRWRSTPAGEVFIPAPPPTP